VTSTPELVIDIALTCQMLSVTVFDQLHSASEDRRIGENGKINIHSGVVNWEERLEAEIANRIGVLLVTGDISSTSRLTLDC
jgi:hypothetical protein